MFFFRLFPNIIVLRKEMVIVRRKTFVLASILAVMVIGLSLRIYGVSDFKESDFVNINSPGNLQRISSKVLDDTGRGTYISPDYIKEIAVYTGDITGDGADDKILLLNFGPDISLIAVYAATDDGYEYIGELGLLSNVTALEIKRLAAENRDVIAIKEESVQQLGSYEYNVFVRGYLWNKNRFINIISIPETIEADWNKLWDDESIQWNRVRHNAQISWEGIDPPKVYINGYQEYFVSSDITNKNIRADDTYTLQNSRNISQTFTWSEEFSAFVLEVRNDLISGERVGVVENLNNSPYYIVLEYAQYLNKYRTITKNGDIIIRQNTELSEPLAF